MVTAYTTLRAQENEIDPLLVYDECIPDLPKDLSNNARPTNTNTTRHSREGIWQRGTPAYMNRRGHIVQKSDHAQVTPAAANKNYKETGPSVEMLSEYNKYTRRRTAYEAIVAHGALVIPMSPAAGPGWDTSRRTSASIIWTERLNRDER